MEEGAGRDVAGVGRPMRTRCSSGCRSVKRRRRWWLLVFLRLLPFLKRKALPLRCERSPEHPPSSKKVGV